MYRLQRFIASTLLVAMVLTLLPPPPATAQTPTVEAIDPLQIAAASVDASSAVTPVYTGRMEPALPSSAYLPPTAIRIPFQAFPVVDPDTGKKVDPDATIYLKHSHRSVNAGKYYDQVNKLEQSLNTMGYTLRKPSKPTFCKTGHEWQSADKLTFTKPCATAAKQGRLQGSDQDELMATVHYVPIGHMQPFFSQRHVTDELSRLDALVTVNPALLNAQTYFAAPEHGIRVPPGAPHPKPPAGVVNVTPICAKCTLAPVPVKDHDCTSKAWFNPIWYGDWWNWSANTPDGIKDKSLLLPHLCKMPEKATLRGRVTPLVNPWSTTLGSQNPAGFTLAANMSIGGDYNKHGLDMSATARATGYLLNVAENIASATATAHGNSGSVDLVVAGNTIWSAHASGKHTDNFSKSINFFSFQVPIPILWFTITLAASADGNFGAQFGVNLSTKNSGFFVGPFMNITATFSASFGISIIIVSVSVGVYGKITLAQVGLKFAATGKFWTPAEYSGKEHKRSNIIGCKLYFQDQVALDATFSALSGQMGVQAQACVDLLFWSDCWTAQLPLFSWTGYSTSGNLFTIPSNPTWTQIGPWYTDRPQYGYPLQKSEHMVYSPDDASGEPAVCHTLGAK